MSRRLRVIESDVLESVHQMGALEDYHADGKLLKRYVVGPDVRDGLLQLQMVLKQENPRTRDALLFIRKTGIMRGHIVPVLLSDHLTFKNLSTIRVYFLLLLLASLSGAVRATFHFLQRHGFM